MATASNHNNRPKTTLWVDGARQRPRGNQGRGHHLRQEGEDTIRGKRSADRLFGEEGADTVGGDLGPDRIRGGDGLDTLLGGMSNDRIIVGGSKPDVVNCGRGKVDFAVIDPEDEVKNCGLVGTVAP